MSRIHTEPETGRTGRGARHQRPQAGRGSPQAGRGPIQQPGRVDRRDGLGARRRRRLAFDQPGIRDHHRLVEPRLDRPPLRRPARTPTIANAAMQMHERAWQGETLPRYELRIRTRPAITWTASSCWSPRFARAPPSASCIIRDITAQKQTERPSSRPRLRRAKEEAERANRAKSEFLSSVSHEIRTPLTAILGFSELLSEHPYLQAGPAEIREHLATIRQNGRFLLALIDDCSTSRGSRRASSASSASLVRRRGSSPTWSKRCGPRRKPSSCGSRWSRRSDTAGDRHRSLAASADPRQPGGQRDQVHREGHGQADGPNDRPAGADRSQFAVSDMGIGMTAAEMVGCSSHSTGSGPRRRISPGGTGLGLAICQAHCQAARGRDHGAEHPGVGLDVHARSHSR